ncbi:MAG: NifU family protein [Fimbriimonadaceae bacterium]|nr:Fe/S biogenesis protein NfuA [Fimbriimonadaceae bacterium]MCL4285909.1 NifU family protein [Fimbriimonadaceae bacterium]MCZ7580124.1 NifU family protein [Fimbriimonadaceae bacterium]WKZ81317.1 MAG: NifU family protein [Fimbriimonadaceae bacterium]HQU19148.1 NifU family protein [Fimbriimonadaceae bacterium]
MTFLSGLFGRRKPTPFLESGPLLDEVRDAMVEVQAYARSHGGRIELIGVDEKGNVSVRFRGTCRGCPLSEITLRNGIEQRLREWVPGVRSVIRRD